MSAGMRQPCRSAMARAAIEQSFGGSRRALPLPFGRGDARRLSRRLRQGSTDAPEHRTRPPGTMIKQPTPEGGRRQGRGVEKSLNNVASKFREQIQLPAGLDAFGDDSKLQALANANHGGNDRSRTGVVLDIPHEAAVDLQFADRQMRETAEAGITGSEIVQRQPNSELANGPHGLDRDRALVQDHAFGDLEHEHFRWQAMVCEDSADRRGEVLVLEIN